MNEEQVINPCLFTQYILAGGTDFSLGSFYKNVNMPRGMTISFTVPH
jgi:hypothetical protein